MTRCAPTGSEPHGDWVGRAVASLPAAPADPDRSATLANDEAWDDVDLAGGPAAVLRDRLAGRPGRHGRAESSSRSTASSPASARCRPATHPGQYAALLPPSLLRTGRNTVELYGVGADGRLSPIRVAGRS